MNGDSSERTSKTVTCNCADVPPTMPTYRTEHLAWCPVWLIQHGAVVQSEITEPVTVRACAHTILVSNDPVRGYQRVAPCPYCETDRLRLALERIAYSNNPALSWLEAKECARSENLTRETIIDFVETAYEHADEPGEVRNLLGAALEKLRVDAPAPVNLPFERVPQHEADPGFGPVPPKPERPKVEPLWQEPSEKASGEPT